MLRICTRHLAYRELGEHGLLLVVIALVGILIIHGGGNGLGVAKASSRFIIICGCLTGCLAGPTCCAS